MIFKDFIHFKFNSFELDANKQEHFNVLKKVINGTPEMKNLDVLKGLPYLLLASQFFDSVLNVFGKSQEENNWEEIPSLAIEPIAGNAFLRSGVYVLYEKTNRQEQVVNLEDMAYQEGRLISTNPKTVLTQSFSVWYCFGEICEITLLLETFEKLVKIQNDNKFDFIFLPS